MFQDFQVICSVMCLGDCLAAVLLVAVLLVVCLAEEDGMEVVEEGKCKTLLSHWRKIPRLSNFNLKHNIIIIIMLFI